MTITEIVRSILPRVTGQEFLKTDAGKEWAVALRDVRNDLVHGSRESLTEADAHRAMIAGDAAAKLIRTQLKL